MLINKEQNRQSQRQGANCNTSIQTPTFTPVSTGFSQLRSQFTQNPQIAQKKSQQSLQVSQQNLLNDSDVYNQQELQKWTHPTSDIEPVGKENIIQNNIINQYVDQPNNQNILKNDKLFGLKIENVDSQEIHLAEDHQIQNQQNQDQQELLIAQYEQQNYSVINSMKPKELILQANDIEDIQKFNQSQISGENKGNLYKQSKKRKQNPQIHKKLNNKRLLLIQKAFQPENAIVFMNQLHNYRQKYQDIKILSKNQKQKINRLQQQLRWSRQQLQSFKKTSKARLEACSQIKDMQITRLKQEILKNTKTIQQLEIKIKSRVKPPNIVIEQVQKQSKTQRKLQQNIKSLEQINQRLKNDLSKTTKQANQKASSLIQQIHLQKHTNYDLKSYITTLQTQMRLLKQQKNQLTNKLSIMMQRQKHLKRIMQKQLSKINQFGGQLVNMVEQQIKNSKNSPLKRNIDSKAVK